MPQSLLDAFSTPWVQMFLLVAGIFALGKIATAMRGQAPLAEKLAFLAFWPGMSLGEFMREPSRRIWLVPRGVANLLLGAALTWLVARHIDSPFWATWLAMAGYVWALHGGVFTLAAAFWRWRGRDVHPLMHAPLLAVSLADFWGRRWNRAFRDLAHQFVLRPLAPHIGTKGAMLVVFLISGILHDVIVTVPAGGGYGVPTAYFLLQGAGMMGESRIPARLGWAKRLLVFAIVVLPLPVAYPPVFVERVALPFFQAIHALP